MTDPSDNPDGRLEGLLRRWGAAEATDQARDATPQWQAPEAPARRTQIVPIAVAASVALLAGLVGGLMLATALDGSPHHAAEGPAARQGTAPQVQPPGAPEAVQMAALRQQAEQLQGRARALAAELASATAKAGELQQARAGALARIETLEGELQGLAGRLAAASTEADKARAQATGAKAQAEQLDKALAAAKTAAAEREEQLGQMRARLAAAAGELDRVGRLYEQAKLDEAQAREQAVAAAALSRAARPAAADFEPMQRAFLAAAAPGQGGLAARQVAARRMQLIRRAGPLRRQVDESTAEVIRRAEVVLMRLDMLDSGDARQAEQFATLVASAGVVARIDGALAEQAMPAARRWLVEARCVLAGVDHVG